MNCYQCNKEINEGQPIGKVGIVTYDHLIDICLDLNCFEKLIGLHYMYDPTPPDYCKKCNKAYDTTYDYYFIEYRQYCHNYHSSCFRAIGGEEFIDELQQTLRWKQL